MMTHEFYKRYANTPMAERMMLLDVNVFGLRSLQNIYQEIHQYDEMILPYKVAQDKLLGQMQDFWIRYDALNPLLATPPKEDVK